MATGSNKLNIKPPSEFSFQPPNDWATWSGRWKQYYELVGLEKETAQTQVATLLYTMGEQANAVLSTFDLPEGSRNQYADVFAKFDEVYTAKKRSAVYERAQFNKRHQRPGESAAAFVMDLRILAKSCEFGDPTDSLIRDRIITGLRDEVLSLALQLDDNLSLDECVWRVLQAENVQKTMSGREDGGEQGGAEQECRRTTSCKKYKSRGSVRQKQFEEKRCERCDRDLPRPDCGDTSGEVCGTPDRPVDAIQTKGTTPKVHKVLGLMWVSY